MALIQVVAMRVLPTDQIVHTVTLRSTRRKRLIGSSRSLVSRTSKSASFEMQANAHPASANDRPLNVYD